MNILFFSVNEVIKEAGGVENVTAFWYNYFELKGINVYILFWKKNSKLTSIIPQEQLPDKYNCNSDLNFHFVLNYLKENKIDFVINQNGVNTSISRFCVSVCNEAKVKIISVIHNSPDYVLYTLPFATLLSKSSIFKSILTTSLKIFQKYGNKRGRYIYKNSSAVVLLSEKYRDIYIDYYLRSYDDASKIKVIHNPMTILNGNNNLVVSSKNILFVGRLSKQKSVIRLLRIWRRIVIKHSDWNLYIVGDGTERSRLENFVVCEKINNVFFKGFTDPSRFYLQSSIFCMTSQYEGFPMVLIEALSYGLIPVIYNSFAASSDIVCDNINGFLIDNGNQEEFINKLEILIENEPLRGEFSRQCIKKAMNWNPDLIFKQWMSLFEK